VRRRRRRHQNHHPRHILRRGILILTLVTTTTIMAMIEMMMPSCSSRDGHPRRQEELAVGGCQLLFTIRILHHAVVPLAAGAVVALYDKGKESTTSMVAFITNGWRRSSNNSNITSYRHRQLLPLSATPLLYQCINNYSNSPINISTLRRSRRMLRII
jgi:hypothetical protein